MCADGIRVRLELLNAVNVPAELFAYRIVPEDSENVAYFSHICSPSDIEEMPANAAQPEASPPWFRLSYADMLFRSRDEADEMIRVVREDIARLFRTLDLMATLGPSQEVTLTSGV